MYLLFNCLHYIKQRESFNWIQHTYEVLDKTESLMYGLVSAESNVRAYIITNDRTNLGGFRSSFDYAEKALANLLHLTSDNRSQQKRLYLLKGLLEERKSLFYENILYRKEKLEDELEFYKEVTIKGNKKMTDIKQIVDSAENEEMKLLRERKMYNETLSVHLFQLTIALSVLSLIIGIIAVFYISKDIRYRRKNENSLKNLDRNKNKFFSIISHDLKGPAGGILKLSEFLLNDNLANDHKEIAKRLNIAAKNHYNLLDNLLTWSRSQMGKLDVNPAILDINKMVSSTVTSVMNLANEKAIEITSLVSPDLLAWGDYNMVQTVTRNLLQNAIKFTPHNGKITVSARDIGKYIEISVADTGVGISKEYLNRLFKIESTFTLKGTDDEEGTGMGLLLCKEFVEKNDGSIRAESEVGEGTTFIFTIPKPVLN